MRWNVLFIAAILLVAASLPSAAQFSVDMNNMTCGSWLGYSPENRDFVRFWMSGYYNAAANSNILNYDRSQKNSAKVAAYCKSHKSQTSADRDQEPWLVGVRTDCIPTAIGKRVRCPLLAQSGHADRRPECPLSGVKRTSQLTRAMSAR